MSKSGSSVTLVAEGEGFEPSLGDLQGVDSQQYSNDRLTLPSPTASPKAGVSCPELGEIVADWANLPASIRTAILTIVRASRKEVDE